jgi:hypothetical protein
MTTADFKAIVERSMTDRVFADQIRRDPESVINEHELDEEEAHALRSGKEERIRDVLGGGLSAAVANIATGTISSG